MTSKWPKSFPPLTSEQQRISDEFMEYWHDVLASRLQLFDQFNHRYVVRHSSRGFHRTLEIGAGTGEHLTYERLSPKQARNYYALELRENMARRILQRKTGVQVRVGDAQKGLDFADGYFDRILAIHVLEHLPNLPAAVQELYRVCNKQHGVLLVVIPCEGGWLYTLSRRISAQRIFTNRYKQPYDWFIKREHVNDSREVLEELKKNFQLAHQHYFPFRVPLVACNLVIGLTLRPLQRPVNAPGH